MYRETLNTNGHEYDKGDTHKQNRPPEKKDKKTSQYDIVITKNIVRLLLKYYLGNNISKLNKILLNGT